ncbi:MAG TPA: hypothetical protein VIH57_10805 [Bacteroidales bacterium]
MKKNNTLLFIPFNISISIFAISFFLLSFGESGGGILETRLKDSSKLESTYGNLEYILFNHGAETPITENYYQTCKTFEIIGYVFMCLAFISIAPLINDYRKKGMILNPFDFSKDHLFTLASKFYGLLIILTLFTQSFIFPKTKSEEKFIEYIIIAYLLSAIVGLIFAGLVKMIQVDKTIE